MSSITIPTFTRAQVLITQGGVTTDVSSYMYGTTTKTDNLNNPTLLDFGLMNYDGNMVMPTRGAYIQVITYTYGVWFSGFITNDGNPTLAGTSNFQPVWAFAFEATSDEYILSLHPLGIIPPFINQYQGQILTTIINLLAPDNFPFDTSNIAQGQLIPRYTVDPTQRFSDVITSFTSSSNYKFWCKNLAANFQRIDSLTCALAIDGNARDFTPSKLTLTAASDAIVNDATVIGNIEPQNWVSEYFISDGSTAQYPLIAAVFSVDSCILLQDDFSNSSIDTTKWTDYDALDNVLVVSNGFLNALGGSNNGSYDVHLDSAQLVPLEGTLRCTHGEFDFVELSSGIVGGLWTNNVSSTLTNCLYGVKVYTTNSAGTVVSPTASGAATSHLAPITLGTVDFTQTAPIDFEKRYIIRTLFTFSSVYRQTAHYSALQQDGSIALFGGDGQAGSFVANTVVTEIDPNTAATTNQWTWNSTGTIAEAQQTNALYVLLACDYLNCSVTAVTVNTPMQVTLEQKAPSGVTPTYAGAGGTLTYTPNPIPVGTNTITLSWTTLESTSVNIRKSSWEGPAVPGGADQGPSGSLVITGVNPGDELFLTDNTTQATLATVTLSGSNGNPWVNQYIGPNELDAQDGVTPVATIVDSNNGASTKQSLLGTSNYNPGQATLTYFKNTSQFQSFIPQKGTLIRCTYRHAGASIGHVRNLSAAAVEAAEWGDDGVRATTLNGLNPLPRTSKECEAAAAAYVAGNCYQHYSGTYMISSGPWLSGEPVTGTILQFQNLDQYPTFPQAITNTCENITEVVTTFDHANTGEYFSHQISFGPIDKMAMVLAKFKKLDQVFTPQDTAEIPFYTSTDAVGNNVLHDALNPVMTSFDRYNFYFSITNPYSTAKGYEVRSSDSGWGLGPNSSNYVTTTYGTTFSIPRVNNNTVIYVRAFDARNYVLYSEALQVQSVTNQYFSADYATQGNWQSLYGADGAYIAAGSYVAPSYGAIVLPGSSTYIWGTDIADDPRAMPLPAGGNIASCWVSYTTFSVDVFISDGNVHQLALYFLDYDNLNRNQTIQMYDSSGTLLDTKTITYFSQGKYLVYNVHTNVTFVITNNAGSFNCVLSGVFFGPTTSAWTTSNATLSQAKMHDPDGNLSVISTLTAGSGTVGSAHFFTKLSGQCTFSLWAKGVAGTGLTIALTNQSGTLAQYYPFTMTGGWQFLTGTYITADYTQISINCLPGTSFNVTRVQVEPGSSYSVYAFTNGSIYGATSRYSYGLHLSIPYIPLPPVGVINPADITAPIITLTLPASLNNIWGIEIRASDNVTVLVHYDMTDPNYLQIPQQPSNYIPNYSQPFYTLSNTPPTRNLTYYLYCYNLLGEYSNPTVLNYMIPYPKIVSVTFDDASLTLSITSLGASSYRLLIGSLGSTDSVVYNGDYYGKVIDQTSSTVPVVTARTLTPQLYIPQNNFNFYPSDEIGAPPNTSPDYVLTVNHAYAFQGPTEVTSNEVSWVPGAPPKGSTVVPATPPALASTPAVAVTVSNTNTYINTIGY